MRKRPSDVCNLLSLLPDLEVPFSGSDPLSSEQPDFDRLRKAHIAKQCDHQNRPVHLRQVYET